MEKVNTVTSVLSFNGRGNYVDCSQGNGLDLTQAITVEAWVYPLENDQWSIIANKWDNKGYFLGIRPDGGGLRWSLNSENGQCTSEPIEFYQWMHVAGTYDGKALKLYQNGTQVASRAFSGSIPKTSVPFQISKQSNSDNWGFLAGSLAEIRVWDRARTQAEIRASMSCRLTGNESGLVGYWPLNEGSGDVAYDKSQNSNHGTLKGASWSEPSSPLSLGLREQSAAEESLQPNRVFPLSVASGDPTESGVILWTRVNPDVYDGQSTLSYEVSSNREFTPTLCEGDVTDFGPERDYTARVDLDNKDKLKPNQRYYYRFSYKNVRSRPGRFKTLPSATDSTFNYLRLAVLTCNDYSSGYFNAFYHLSKKGENEKEVDFVIHLGDFAYEYPQYPEGYGKIYRTDLKLKDEEYPPKDAKAGSKATSLRDFRHIYQKYRTDPALQRAMEEHTWIIMLDDHEIANDAYWDYRNKTLGANLDHGIYNKYQKGTEEADTAMRDLYNHAMQAWTEYVPARWTKVSAAEGGARGEHYKLYRNFRFGNLVDFYLTDSRTYRDEPEGEPWDLNNPLLWGRNTSHNNRMVEALTDAKAKDPGADMVQLMATVRKNVNGGTVPEDWRWSMLGKEQKEWLIDGITNEQSSTIWKVWGNQTLLATSELVEMGGHDDWHGFKAERYEILQRIKEKETKRHGTDEASRFVVFTGDMHTSLISYLKTSFEEDFDPFENQWSWNPLDLINNTMNRSYPKLVGVEFMTPSVTAPGISEGLSAGAKSWLEVKGGSIGSLVDAGLLGLPSAAIDVATSAVSIAADTVTSVGSSLFNIASGVASAVTPSLVSDVAEDAVDLVEGAVDSVGAVLPHPSVGKHTTGNLIKAFSPHIRHIAPHVNGYAIAEFTPDEITWSVYNIDKTKPDDTGGTKELIQSVKYNPEKIDLHDWYNKLA